MDPNGGVNSSNPRLDANGVQPTNQPVTAPTLETATPGPQPVQLPNDLGISDPNIASGNSAGKGKGALKKVLIGLLIILLVAGLAGGGYFVGYASGESKGRTEADAEYQRKQAQAQQEAAEDEATESELDEEAALQIGDLKEPKYVDETVEGEIGKQLSSSDGLILKVLNIERNFKSTDSNYKLDSSKELVKVNFLIGNGANDKPKDISSFSFRLENSVNALLTPENIAEYPDKFDTLKLDTGAQMKGSIVYAVNKDEKPLKFVREQRYRITTENREVTTRIVVSLAK